MAVNSYRYVFAASTPELPSSGTTVDLGIGQIGVFDGKTYQATSGVTAKSIIVAQGTPDTVFPQGVAKSNATYKSSVITGNAVKGWKRVLGKKGRGMEVTLGFDGVDTTKNLNVKEADSFTFWITLSGTPIANLLGDTPKTHYAVWTEQFTVQLPCVDPRSDNYIATYDPNVVGDAVIAEINKRKIIGGQFLTDYIQATKLVSCKTPSGLPTVSYTVYTLTVADNGDQAALGKVQAQYPGEVIKRIKRNGIFSTYEVTVLTSDGAPTAFSNEQFPVVPACAECPSGCPSGYTLQEAQDVWVVQRPLSEDTDLHDNTARTAFAEAVESDYSANASEFLSYNGSTASVKLYFDAGTSVSALLSDAAIQIGTNESICVQDSPESISWVSCKTCTAATKDFVITIKDSCDVDYLALLQAEYGDGVSLVSENSDTCTSQYKLTVQSDNKDCDACAEVLWTFTAPKPFQGLVWTEVLGEHYGKDCNIGIRFKSIYEQRKAKECFLKQVAYEFEPLFISVSTRNPDPNNYSVLCETDVPVTVVQNVEYPKGIGRVVADQVIASNYQFNQPWRKNAAERDAFEYELGIDLQGVYDQYILTFETYPDEFGASHFGTTQLQRFELSVFFPQGTGNAYESAITAFLASNASPVVLEDIGSI